MPRFPVQPQRTSAPAAFSRTPRAQAAHFGAGIGRHLADLGVGAAELGQVIEQRQSRQAEQQMSNFDRDLAKRRAESDAQAPPEEDSESRITRHQSLFESSADAVLQHYEGQALHGRLSEGIEARRDAYRQKLLAREAHQRLRTSLDDTQALVQQWSERVAQDPTEFATASLELFGDKASGEAGLLAGLGLRPEALAAWKTHSLNQLLDARVTSDPAGLIAELETGRWQDQLSEERREQLRVEAGEAQQRRASAEAIELGQQRGGAALRLSNDIGSGRAGQGEIRRAEEVGTLSAPQAEALRAEVERAEIARQAQQVAGDELVLTFSTGIGFDPENPQNRRAADAFYEKTYSPALREGAAEEVVAQVVTMVAKTGYMPPRLAKDTTGLLLGSDEAGQVQGAELYGRLREFAPELVEDSIDLEARARGGVLKRWLDAGLEPGDALVRAKADLMSEGTSSPFNQENKEAFRQDLRKRLGERMGGVVAAELLMRLESKYLKLLGEGRSPQKARAEIQRDQGRAFIRLAQTDSWLAEAGFVWSERHGERVLIPTEPRLQKMAVPAVVGAGAAIGSVILVAAAYSYTIQTAKDWGFEVPEVMDDLDSWLNGLSEETRIYVFETVPDIAGWLDKAVVRLGDDQPRLADVVKEDEVTNTRSVAFFLPGHGRLILHQQYDITAERYDSLEVTFYDKDKKRWVTEKYASSRFNQPAGSVGGQPKPGRGTTAPTAMAPDDSRQEGGQAIVVPSDEHRPIIQPGPSADPVPTSPLPPSEAGPGRELMPGHTGGNQTELGPRTDRIPGYPAQEQEPLILINPEQSDELNVPIVLLSEDYTKNSTLTIGPYAGELIPGYRGRIRAREQRLIEQLMKKDGCHTCGTHDPGTTSGKAIGDHQPSQALEEPKWFLPHCVNCSRRQGGEVTQEKRRRNMKKKKKGGK
ncbi:hypothetical protein [Denitrobaculum tricleocarpae]|uniref:Uncharacterized protein n=1 Tax=Denitrobaculum tricleocarpae TaxID=2591009 RepID=A0A545TUF1_9PROT|nr:hypothetical protein [Denitrobaculum tricleocarpae]TQV80791.1 hypothetical protein FKG95_11620 [Denitrobaculum tricleocarpae]